ncbi:ERAD-associated E3 ubiquitin-protein ligase HRD1, partial [Dissostichus eleginoides]
SPCIPWAVTQQQLLLPFRTTVVRSNIYPPSNNLSRLISEPVSASAGPRQADFSPRQSQGICGGLTKAGEWQTREYKEPCKK